MEDYQDKKPALYTQLVDALLGYITSYLQPGEKLLSEREICEAYGVSRTTVRQALSELEDNGYVYKSHGKGTFVSPLFNERNNLSETYSFTEHMQDLGRHPHSKLLLFERVSPHTQIREIMKLPEGDVYRFKRLRLADMEPLIIETTYVPEKFFPNLSADLLEINPLYTLMKKVYNLYIAYMDEEFAASTLHEKEASILQQEPGNPCLRLRRVSHLFSNEIVEFTISVARADQFMYKTRHFSKR